MGLKVQATQSAGAPVKDLPRNVKLLLNAGHAIDHMFLLIFAFAVGVIAVDFEYARW